MLRRNCLVKLLLKEMKKVRLKWQEDEEENVRSYWTILRKLEDTVTWTGTH
jgi:hypothetical protein